MPIFDGAARFNVVLSYEETKQIEKPGYSGPVLVCNARYVPIAGHRALRPSTKFMQENRDMPVWLAPVDGADLLVPLRISVQTMVGMSVVEASQWARPGYDRRWCPPRRSPPSGRTARARRPRRAGPPPASPRPWRDPGSIRSVCGGTATLAQAGFRAPILLQIHRERRSKSPIRSSFEPRRTGSGERRCRPLRWTSAGRVLRPWHP